MKAKLSPPWIVGATPRDVLRSAATSVSVFRLRVYGSGGTLLTPLSFHGSLHNLVAEDGIGLADIWQPEHGMPHAQAAAWLFESGEIWSFELLNYGKTIPFAEKRLVDHLNQYVKLLVSLGLKGPYRWIAGLTNVKDFELETPQIDGRPARVGRPPMPDKYDL